MPCVEGAGFTRVVIPVEICPRQGGERESRLDPRLRGGDTKKPVAYHRFLCVTFSRLSFLPSLALEDRRPALLRRLHPLRPERVLCPSSQLQSWRGQPALLQIGRASCRGRG